MLAQGLSGQRRPPPHRQAPVSVDREQRYLPLDEAPFDREEARLNPAAGACLCLPTPQQIQSSLFFDIAAEPARDIVIRPEDKRVILSCRSRSRGSEKGTS